MYLKIKKMPREYTPDQKKQRALNYARWKAANPEKVKEHHKKYREKHRERVRAASLKHYNENYKRPREKTYNIKKNK